VDGAGAGGLGLEPKAQHAVAPERAQEIEHLRERRVEAGFVAWLGRPVAQAVDRLNAEAEREVGRHAGGEHGEQLAWRDRR
jgi:hypothetical protein